VQQQCCCAGVSRFDNSGEVWEEAGMTAKTISKSIHSFVFIKRPKLKKRSDVSINNSSAKAHHWPYP
jgi:hypothetical protein